MTMNRTRLSLLTLTALTLAACSSSEQPIEPISTGQTPRVESTGGFQLPQTRGAESSAKVLEDYGMYEYALRAAKQGDDMTTMQFLSRQSQSAMGEAVRNEWLKSLARRGDWTSFNREYAQLTAEGRSQEVRCYAELQSGQSELAKQLVRNVGKLSEGCTRLI